MGAELSEKGKLHDRRLRRIINKLQILYLERIMLVLRLMKLIYMDCIILGCVDGRYVEEAANVFEIRVQACQQRHEDHLHVYVSSMK